MKDSRGKGWVMYLLNYRSNGTCIPLKYTLYCEKQWKKHRYRDKETLAWGLLRGNIKQLM